MLDSVLDLAPPSSLFRWHNFRCPRIGLLNFVLLVGLSSLYLLEALLDGSLPFWSIEDEFTYMDLLVIVVVEGEVNHICSEVCSVEVWKCENSGLFRSPCPGQVMHNLWPWMGTVLIPANYDSIWVEILGTLLITAYERDTIECHVVGECEIDICM